MASRRKLIPPDAPRSPDCRIAPDVRALPPGGGSDTHLLLDVEPLGLRGQPVQDALERVGITSSRNPVPYDSRKPSPSRGERLGGFGDIIGRTIEGTAADAAVSEFAASSERRRALCADYPVYR